MKKLQLELDDFKNMQISYEKEVSRTDQNKAKLFNFRNKGIKNIMLLLQTLKLGWKNSK